MQTLILSHTHTHTLSLPLPLSPSIFPFLLLCLTWNALNFHYDTILYPTYPSFHPSISFIYFPCFRLHDCKQLTNDPIWFSCFAIKFNVDWVDVLQMKSFLLYFRLDRKVYGFFHVCVFFFSFSSFFQLVYC